MYTIYILFWWLINQSLIYTYIYKSLLKVAKIHCGIDKFENQKNNVTKHS